jgi:RNA polymerase sigma-70 factor (ECF subfamily)
MNSKNIPLPEWELQSKSEDPETRLLKKQEAEDLLKAIKRLPDHYREIIELKHFQECSYAEMAEILAIPVGTVMSRLYNGRMKLREELSKEEA